MPQLINLVRFLFEAYTFIMLARVLLSWFPVDPSNPLVRIVHQLTEPLLSPIRRLLPQSGALDFSPIVAFVVLIVAEQIVLRILISLG